MIELKNSKILSILSILELPFRGKVHTKSTEISSRDCYVKKIIFIQKMQSIWPYSKKLQI